MIRIHSSYLLASAVLGFFVAWVIQDRRLGSQRADDRAYSAYPFSQLLPMAEQCLRDAEERQVTSWLCVGRYDRDDDGDVDADDLESIRQAAAERWEGWRRRMVADPEEAERMRVVMDRVVEAMRGE